MEAHPGVMEVQLGVKVAQKEVRLEDWEPELVVTAAQREAQMEVPADQRSVDLGVHLGATVGQRAGALEVQ